LSRTRTIWIKTFLTTGLHVGLAVTLFVLLGSVNWLSPVELRAAVTLIIFLVAAILAMATSLIFHQVSEQLGERRRLRYEPLINETLALEVVNGGQIEALKQLARECASVMSDCIGAELSCITGSAHRHISEVACELGMLDRWVRQLRSRQSLRRCQAVRLLASLEPSMARTSLVAALADDDEQVRIEAGRALVRWGEREEIEEVLKFAASQPLLLGALVAEDLRPVMTICEPYLAEVLCSDDIGVVTGTLDIIEAWQKTLSIAGFGALLNHPGAAVRVKAPRLAPYIQGIDGAESVIIRALFDDSYEVRAAAAYAAGRMGLRKAIPYLHSLVQTGDDRVSLSAARALSRLGDNGTAALEAEILGGGRCAAFALEALEKAQLSLDLRVPA